MSPLAYIRFSSLGLLRKCYTVLTLTLVYIQLCLHHKPRATYEGEHVGLVLFLFQFGPASPNIMFPGPLIFLQITFFLTTE